MRWRYVLAVIGLCLFAFISYGSFRRGLHTPRYFWWSALRLDRHPLGNTTHPPAQPASAETGQSWEPEQIWVDPDPVSTIFVISTMPAFLLAKLTTRLLGKLGADELIVFMFMMPVLTTVWFFLLGSVMDHRLRKGLTSV